MGIEDTLGTARAYHRDQDVMVANMQIRFCQRHEVDRLQDFIRHEWSADHIFVNSKTLLDYQHLDASQDRYHFVVAADDAGQFHAVLGFIPPGHFQADDDTLWLALWKTAAACKDKSIGLRLLKFLETTFPEQSIATAGISEQARLIYKALRFDVVKLSHYYLTTAASASRIAIGLRPFDGRDLPVQFKLSEGALAHVQTQPSAHYRRRSAAYFQKKYAGHPVYAYTCVHDANNDLTLVYRLVEIPEGKVMRIIDCAGNLQALPGVTVALMERVREIGADYIDMLAYWADEQPILQAGFKPVSDEIIPNYFEPFVQKNVVIECAVKGRNMAQLVVMKGDGDQDRPSRIKGVNA